MSTKPVQSAPKPVRAADRQRGTKLPPSYQPPFRELTPASYDLYAGRNLAMLARGK